MKHQMDEAMMALVRVDLIAAMDQWLPRADSRGLKLPWVGENVAAIMADAALAVLRGMDDSQAYLIKEKVMED